MDLSIVKKFKEQIKQFDKISFPLLISLKIKSNNLIQRMFVKDQQYSFLTITGKYSTQQRNIQHNKGIFKKQTIKQRGKKDYSTQQRSIRHNKGVFNKQTNKQTKGKMEYSTTFSAPTLFYYL